MIGRHNHYCSQKYIFYLFKKKVVLLITCGCIIHFPTCFDTHTFRIFQGFYQKIICFSETSIFFFNLKNSTTSKLKLLLTLKPNVSYMQVANTIFHPRKN